LQFFWIPTACAPRIAWRDDRCGCEKVIAVSFTVIKKRPALNPLQQTGPELSQKNALFGQLVLKIVGVLTIRDLDIERPEIPLSSPSRSGNDNHGQLPPPWSIVPDLERKRALPAAERSGDHFDGNIARDGQASDRAGKHFSLRSCFKIAVDLFTIENREIPPQVPVSGVAFSP